MGFYTSDNKNNDILGYRIREARIARGYTLNQIADILGVTKQSVSKYENDLAKISIENILKLVSALDLPIEFFTKTKESGFNHDEEQPIFFLEV